MENKTMRYIKIEGGTAFCGCDFEEYLETDMTDEELNRYCAEAAYDNASMYENIERDYSIYQEDYATEEEYETAIDEATDEYYGEAYADWEEITKEEYDEESL